jgi:hypothetical protein
MKLPFTSEDFFRIFKEYNLAIYPSQFILLGLALLAIIVIARRWRTSGQIVFGALAILWLWMGVVYHWMHFAQVNKAAYVFGAGFVAQGLLFLYEALAKKRAFAIKRDARSIAGLMLIAYALLIYPVLGYIAGHGYPYSPTFGLPCPTTIFTFGICLLATDRLPRYLFAVPILWALIGSSAAFGLGVYEDIGLLIAAVITIVSVLAQNKRPALKQSAASTPGSWAQAGN